MATILFGKLAKVKKNTERVNKTFKKYKLKITVLSGAHSSCCVRSARVFYVVLRLARVLVCEESLARYEFRV